MKKGNQPTKFKIMRNKYGLSQAQAARIMNRPLSTVSKWDGGFSKCADRILEEFDLRFNALHKKS